MQPKDLLSDSNINLGNIPSARKLYKVHSLRCTISLLAPLCLARNIHGDGAHGISPPTPAKSGNAALVYIGAGAGKHPLTRVLVLLDSTTVSK